MRDEKLEQQGKYYDVAILGYGFSAMIAALSFAHRGKKVAIITSKKDSKNDNRTTALSLTSWNFLNNILEVGGSSNELQRISALIADIYVLDDKDCGKTLHFPAKLIGEKAMGYIVVNNEFKELLRSKVKEHKFITIFDEEDYNKIENQEEECLIYFQNFHINAALLLICSGKNSLAYKKYFKPHTLKDYNQKALTFNTKHDIAHENTAVEHFMPHGPFAILPLNNPYESAIVWTLSNDLADIYSKMPQREFEYYLQKNFGGFLGNVNLISSIDAFPLKAYITEKYFIGRIALAADSAHIIHPLAGQGLNQGIKDIIALTELSVKYGICKSTLEQYQALRKYDNISMFLITHNLDRIFSNHLPVLSILRKRGLSLIDKSNLLKKQFINYACGIRS